MYQEKELKGKEGLQTNQHQSNVGTPPIQLASVIGNQAMLQLMGLKKEEKKPNTTGIPDQMKQSFEERSGLSFDDVKVHYNSDKPAQLQALAYTQGNQVYVGPGQEKHLGHELGHVVQQKQGRVRATTNVNGVAVNDDEGLEREADHFDSFLPQSDLNIPYSVNVAQRMQPEELTPNPPLENQQVQIRTKKQLPIGGVAINPAERAQLSYVQNKLIPATTILNLAAASGVLLVRQPNNTFHIINIMQQNHTIANVAENQAIDQVITTGITTCSFIVITNATRDFALVAHLDAHNHIDDLLQQMVEQNLVPTHIYASIIDQTANPNAIEKQRIKTIVTVHNIPNVKIINRGENYDAIANGHDIMGFNTQTFDAFGEMGYEHRPQNPGAFNFHNFLRVHLARWRDEADNTVLHKIITDIKVLSLHALETDILNYLKQVGTTTGFWSIFNAHEEFHTKLKNGAKKCLDNPAQFQNLLDICMPEIQKVQIREQVF